MILSPPVGWTARLQAERTVPRDSRSVVRNGSFKVRRWPEGDRTAGAMASIAPGAASPYPTGIPHPSEPPTSSQPERWRLPWRRRQCQPSTGIRGFGEVRDSIRWLQVGFEPLLRPRVRSAGGGGVQAGRPQLALSLSRHCRAAQSRRQLADPTCTHLKAGGLGTAAVKPTCKQVASGGLRARRALWPACSGGGGVRA